MDNLPQQQSTNPEENNNNTPSTPTLEKKFSKVKWLIIGILSALILITTAIFIWFGFQKSTTQDENQPSQAKNEQPGESVPEKYSVLYLHTSRKGQEEVVRLLIANAATQDKTEIATMIGLQNFSTNPYIISKNGKYIGKYSRNSIEVATAEQVLFQKIVELSDKSEEVAYFVWLDDGSKIVYGTTKRNPDAKTFEQILESSEMYFYLIDKDGSHKKLITKIRAKDCIGCGVAGFSVSKNELYLIDKKIAEKANQGILDELLILNLSTGATKIIYKIPEPGAYMGEGFSVDFRKYYYVSKGENKIAEYDFINNVEKIIYELPKIDQDNKMLRLPIASPRDENLILLTLSGNDPNYRKIQSLNPSNGQINTLFESADHQYRAMHITEKSISPNDKFIWIETDQGVYILDTLNKKMDSFFQKQPNANEGIGFLGWLVE